MASREQVVREQLERLDRVEDQLGRLLDEVRAASAEIAAEIGRLRVELPDLAVDPAPPPSPTPLTEPPVGGDAGFFLWCEVPGGDEQAAFARLRDLGILAAPGSMFGAGGEGYIRFALVPGEEECRRAAKILDGASR